MQALPSSVTLIRLESLLRKRFVVLLSKRGKIHHTEPALGTVWHNRATISARGRSQFTPTRTRHLICARNRQRLPTTNGRTSCRPVARLSLGTALVSWSSWMNICWAARRQPPTSSQENEEKRNVDQRRLTTFQHTKDKECTVRRSDLRVFCFSIVYAGLLTRVDTSV